jgi:hypothetical protein
MHDVAWGAVEPGHPMHCSRDVLFDLDSCRRKPRPNTEGGAAQKGKGNDGLAAVTTLLVLVLLVVAVGMFVPGAAAKLHGIKESVCTKPCEIRSLAGSKHSSTTSETFANPLAATGDSDGSGGKYSV